MAISISQIHIAYGSESGNASALAQQLVKVDFLQPYAITLSSLNELPLNRLNNETLLVVLTSSFGDGEPPANADIFLEKLESISKLDCYYAVFGLGDITYNKFCGYSQLVEQTLVKKQVMALIERVDADLNYQEIFKQWLPLLKTALMETKAIPIRHNLSVQVYGENTTFQAEVLALEHLVQSSPAVYHLRLSLKGSGIFYQAGDLIYVQTLQPESLLRQYAQWFNDDAVYEVLRHKELRLLSKNVLRDLNKICANDELKDLLKISNKKSLESYLYGRDVLDVLKDFDAQKQVSLNQLSDILAPLSARAYSISSCGKTHSDYVDLCVRQVSYQLNQRDYNGTVSHYLANLNLGDKVAIFARSNPTFHLPTTLPPAIVMIGSGTGIAPFIGFLQALETQQASTKSYLFFGERHRDKDFLYQNELEQYQATGRLAQLFTAFSRDQAEKYYVQDELKAQGELIWQLIQQGAYFYVCGSKTMSKAIDECLIQIAQEKGNQPYIDAFNNIVAQLVAEGRLLRDIY